MNPKIHYRFMRKPFFKTPLQSQLRRVFDHCHRKEPVALDTPSALECRGSAIDVCSRCFRVKILTVHQN